MVGPATPRTQVINARVEQMPYLIDTSELEARAATLAVIESSLGPELDACETILADLSLMAERAMGGIMCGVSAAQLVGLSSGEDLVGDIIPTRGNSFVGGIWRQNLW